MNLLQRVLSPVSKQITDEVVKELKKKNNAQTFGWDEPYLFNNLFNSSKRRRDEEGSVSYAQLRYFSVHYPIARACIDYLKRKIMKLDWQIIGSENDDDPRSVLLTDFFMAPQGYNSKYTEFTDQLIEDYSVIGAFAIEKVKTRNNQFLLELKTVDSATIQVLTDGYGRVPRPPLDAYKQIIQGKEQARLTADELIYVKRNARSNSMYGLSPLQSILTQAEAAIRGAEYSLAWFTDGNIPEGFGEVPEGWSTKQIKEFQNYFDAVMAGNVSAQRKIKMVPSGFKYTPAKKPEQIAFERFELWMLQLTCSVFGVPPQDIGFTHNTNKSTGEVQQEIGQEMGMRPLAQTLERTFTDIIKYDFGYKDLEFKFVDLDPTDAKLEAEIQDLRIRNGIDSVDEVRVSEGKEPVGISNYRITSTINDKQEVEENDKKDKEDDEEKKLRDLRLWKKHSIDSVKQNRPFKKWFSEYIDNETIEEVHTMLSKCSTVDQVFHAFQPYLDGRVKGLTNLNRLLDEINSN